MKPQSFVERHYPLLLLAILLTTLICQLAFLNAQPLIYREGINLQVSQLIRQGYAPYAEIFTLANPLFIKLLDWVGRFSASPVAIKGVFLGFSLLLILNTSIIARLLMGKAAALAAAILLATTVTFIAEAADVLATIPALSLGMLALVVLSRYQRNGQLGWLMLSALIWTIAVFIDMAALPLGGMFLLWLLFIEAQPDGQLKTGFRGPSRWQAMLVWSGAALIFIIIGIVLAPSDIFLGQILANYRILWANSPPGQAANYVILGQFIAFDLWLFLLTIYGAARAYQNADHPLWLMLAWLLLSFVWLMLRIDLELTDIAILLPPLTISAGWGLTDLIDRFRYRTMGQGVSLSLGLVALIVYLLFTGRQLNALNFPNIQSEGDLAYFTERPAIAQFIREQTSEGDCVIVDDATLGVAAQRLPAPPLVDLSRVRVEGGLLNEAELIDLVSVYDCRVVVFTRRDFNRHLAEFRGWSEEHYPHEQQFPQTRVHYR